MGAYARRKSTESRVSAKSPRRMAEGAVWGEPVSGGRSLLCWESTGKSLESVIPRRCQLPRIDLFPGSERAYSLGVRTGKLSLWLRQGWGILDLMPPGESDCGGFPCIFPADQGSRPRDEFAPDSPHRHSVCCCRDFPRALGHSPRNSRDSAGFCAFDSGASEPETAGSEPKRGRHPRLSLLPSWAVRIRSRFACLFSISIRDLRRAGRRAAAC